MSNTVTVSFTETLTVVVVAIMDEAAETMADMEDVGIMMETALEKVTDITEIMGVILRGRLTMVAIPGVTAKVARIA